MKKSLFLIFTVIAINIQAQKLPEDALDSNTVLLFNPESSVDNSAETLEFFKEKYH